MPRKKSVYNFPTGKSKNGETLKDAALREFREETGVRTKALVDLGITEEMFEAFMGKDTYNGGSIFYFLKVQLDEAQIDKLYLQIKANLEARDTEGVKLSKTGRPDKMKQNDMKKYFSQEDSVHCDELKKVFLGRIEYEKV